MGLDKTSQAGVSRASFTKPQAGGGGGAKTASDSGAQVTTAGGVGGAPASKCAGPTARQMASRAPEERQQVSEPAASFKSDQQQQQRQRATSGSGGHVATAGEQLLRAARALDNNNDATFQVHGPGGTLKQATSESSSAPAAGPASDRGASSAAPAACCDKEASGGGGGGASMEVDGADCGRLAERAAPPPQRDNEQERDVAAAAAAARLGEFKPPAAPSKAPGDSCAPRAARVAARDESEARCESEERREKTRNCSNQNGKAAGRNSNISSSSSSLGSSSGSGGSSSESGSRKSGRNQQNQQNQQDQGGVGKLEEIKGGDKEREAGAATQASGENYLSFSEGREHTAGQPSGIAIELGAAQQQPRVEFPTTTTASNQNNNNNSSNNFCAHFNECNSKASNQREDGGAALDLNFIYAASDGASKRPPPTPKRLGYFQSLLLRQWPCLALSICIMSSLLFGVLLSALTIYLLHGASDCGQLALAAGASEAAAIGPSAASLVAGGGGPPLHHHHHHQHLHSASLLPRELLRPAGEFGLESAGPHESVGAAGSPPVEPLELVGRQLARGDANETAPLVGAAMSPNQSSGNNNNSTAAVAFQRLPAALAPEHYNLFIWPHIAEPSFHFNGSVEIQLKCRESTTNITLHTLELELLTNSIELLELPAGGGSSSNETQVQRRRRRRASSGALKVARVSQDKQLQYSIIHLDGALVAGRDYLLRLDFVGALNDDLAGFYKIKYERQNSTETTWIAATQFQATDARRAFPCFDEPHYKATFSIKIRHWKNMTALSNMPIVRSENSSDGLWITDTFAKSHRMSTYLVAWTVTNFESRSDGNISVWTRPGFGHTAEYALKIAGRILRHYEQFFGIAYPLPKMDMIALPDFNAGAMENWGLVTYRETAMLFDENASTVANKQRVAVVVAHELAHQWFGNLVTPKWWDDLWLNEGFASFVEYIGVDHVEPKWRMLEQFVIEEVQNVFKVDGLSSSHQISIPVNNPDEISEIFDHISYAKGASIIRMMSHFLTERVFKLGLQRYLRALKYNNAEQSDLWAHLTEAQRQLQGAAQGAVNSSSSAPLVKRASNSTATTTTATIVEPVNVERVMNSWTLQTGYPLVTLTRNYDDEAAAGQAGTLDQVRYQPYKLISANTHNSTAAAAANSSQASRQQRWEIPITMTWKSEQRWQPVTRLWMRQNESEPTALSRALAGAKSDEWIVMNVQQVGYYRVNYDQRNWRLLIAQLAEDHTKILPTNRAQLLDDLFELAKSSLIDYRLAMEATKYLKSERDYLAWEAVLISFGYIDEMLQRTPIYGAWQDYFIQLIEPLYARYKHLEWTLPTGGQNNSNNASTQVAQLEPTPDKNDVLESYNQNNAISWACKLNYEHCVKRARATFAQWRASGRNNIKPALRYPAYCTAIEHGTKEDWDFLWRVYEREQGVSERDRILRALGCSREIWVLSRYLDWTFTKSKPIRRQDGAYVFRMIAKNNYGRDIAFNFMRERWATIREYYGKTSFTLGHLIKSAATSMNTQVELDQLKAFFESIKSDVGTGKRSFQIAIEEVESNVFWRDRNYKILENWLQGQQPAAAAAAA